MTKVRILSFCVGVVLLIVSIIAITCFPGSNKGQFINMAKMLPEDLNQLTFIDAHTLQNDDNLASLWSVLQEQMIGSDVYGENISKLTGFGIVGSGSGLSIYTGNFDGKQIEAAIEQESMESYDYKGVTVWEIQSPLSVAVINNFVFIGYSEDIQLCINVSVGEGSSLYQNKDAKDVINRLPGGYALGVVVASETDTSAAAYGLLAIGMAQSRSNGNISEVRLLKFNSSDMAQQYIDYSQIPSAYVVTRYGEYVKTATAWEIPSQNESDYDNVYTELQNAVMVYAANNSGAFPVINGSIDISGYDMQIVDICSLLASQGGLLAEVPEGIASVNGSNNDNCDAGCPGCLETSHYVWAIDEYGYVYSTCVGDDCNANSEDGFQGVWP